MSIYDTDSDEEKGGHVVIKPIINFEEEVRRLRVSLERLGRECWILKEELRLEEANLARSIYPDSKVVNQLRVRMIHLMNEIRYIVKEIQWYETPLIASPSVSPASSPGNSLPKEFGSVGREEGV